MAEPIKNRQSVAPTPQNTPASVSTLQSQTPRARAAMASIRESAGAADGADANLLASLIQSRLGGLAGLKSGYIESLPKPVKERVSALKGLRSRQAKIHGDYQREKFELEKKYLAKQQPLYDERRRLITGQSEPKPEDIEMGENAFEEEKMMFDIEDEEEDSDEYDDDDEDDDDDEEDEEKAKKNNEKVTRAAQKLSLGTSSGADAIEDEYDGADLVGVPNFWLTALRNVPWLAEIITDRDADVLASLVDIRLKYQDAPGFILEFEFGSNPYFSNRVLTKTYYYAEEVGLNGDFMFDHTTGDTIKWTSSDVNVTIRVEKRKQRNKHTGATRTIEKAMPEDSFFNFFTPPAMPREDDEQAEDLDDEYTARLRDDLEQDFAIGEVVKDKVIPGAVDWFTGRAYDYEGLGPEDEDDLEDEDEFDEDDDEADEAEAGESVDDLKKEVPPDCKQQ